MPSKTAKKTTKKKTAKPARTRKKTTKKKDKKVEIPTIIANFNGENVSSNKKEAVSLYAQSRFGERLDFYFDTLGNVFLYFGLWYSQYYLAGNWFVGGAIIASHYVVIALGYMFLATLMYKTVFKTIGSLMPLSSINSCIACL